MSDKPNRVAVIGAGITGTTTAYSLVKRGFDVTLFDKNPYPAMETSFANGGQLSASNAEVWNRWATVFKGMKWMVIPGAPLLVNPKISWHKLSWMGEFIASIPSYEANTIATVRMAIEARKHLWKMADDENIAFDQEERGILHFYKTKAEFDTATKVTEILGKGGLERRAVTTEEIKDLEPSLRGEIFGGFYTETDFTGDIHKFTNGLGAACARHGVDMRLSTDVLGVVADESEVTIRSRPAVFRRKDRNQKPINEKFDQIVVCSGVKSRDFASDLGDRVNIYPVKGYSITVNLLEEEDRKAAPWMSLLDDNAKIVTSRLGEDRFRVAGTAEFNGFNRDIPWRRIEPLIDWCRRHFPGMSTRQCVPWAGLRPMMPNMMPCVRQGKCSRVFYNTGHGHLGWTLSAATADAVSALMEAESRSNRKAAA